MSENKISVTSNNSYAQALFELAEEDNCVNEIEKQVSNLMILVSQNKDFDTFIKDPTNKNSDLTSVMKKICEKFEFNVLFNKFLNFLVLKRRLFYLEKILNDFFKYLF